jgi:hypothetical protein
MQARAVTSSLMSIGSSRAIEDERVAAAWRLLLRDRDAGVPLGDGAVPDQSPMTAQRKPIMMKKPLNIAMSASAP